MKETNLGMFGVSEITANTVKKYLTGGGGATNEELAYLITLCKNNNMNPFTKEVYFIKYSDAPAQIVVSRDFYRKRAMRNENFKGIETGAIVQEKDGEVKKVEGAFKTKDQELVGAWARVYMKNYDLPVYVAVSYDEYVQTKNGKPNKMWAEKPCTMLVKVAESQALRMAFPEEFSGTYSEEEIVREERDVTDTCNSGGSQKPTEQEMHDFDKEQYVQGKIEKLKQEQEQREAEQVDGETGEILNKSISLSDF